MNIPMLIKTKNPKLYIKIASKSDTPLILSFIRELAEYEKLSHEVVATEALLEENLFGESPIAEVILGYYEEHPVGFALFFRNFSTFVGRPGIYLEDLYVKPEMRGKGIGKIMISYLAKLAVERNCGRFEWRVLDWNEPAVNFYRAIGAVAMDEWTEQRLSGEALVSLAQEFNCH